MDMNAELRRTRGLLFGLLNNYSPTWRYEMGRVGYECSFCGVLIRGSADFDKPELHRDDCSYIAANALRFEPNPLRNSLVSVLKGDQALCE